MLGWNRKNLNLTFAVGNLFNQKYWRSDAMPWRAAYLYGAGELQFLILDRKQNKGRLKTRVSSFQTTSVLACGIRLIPARPFRFVPCCVPEEAFAHGAEAQGMSLT